MRGNGRVFRPKGSRNWHLAWSHRGIEYRRSAATSNKTEAQQQLRDELQKIKQGIHPGEDRVTYEDLRRELIHDYEVNKRKSLYDLKHSRLTHLDKAFGRMRACDISDSRLKAYMAERLREGAANASVNRERAALMRMFALGIESRMISANLLPRIRPLRESNARQGFFEREQLDCIVRHLPDYLVAVVRAAYFTGWRRSELLSRKKHHVDLRAGFLRLEPGETKNGEGREFPLTRELRAVLTTQLEATADFERERGRIVPWLFHRNGRPLASFRKAWARACRESGLGGKVPHDFRRTAVRNLERAGVSRSAAMRMTGHLTESVYRRYAIVDSAMLREAADKLDKLTESPRELGKKSES